MAHMVIYKHIMMTSSNRSISTLLALCVGNSPVTDEFPAQRPLMRSFDVFCDLRLDNGWVNNCEVGDWRRHRTHYDVIMICCIYLWGAQSNSTVCAFFSLQSWILCSIMKYVFFLIIYTLARSMSDEICFFVLLNNISNRNIVMMTSPNRNIFRVTGLLWVVIGGFAS